MDVDVVAGSRGVQNRAASKSTGKSKRTKGKSKNSALVRQYLVFRDSSKRFAQFDNDSDEDEDDDDDEEEEEEVPQIKSRVVSAAKAKPAAKVPPKKVTAAPKNKAKQSQLVWV